MCGLTTILGIGGLISSRKGVKAQAAATAASAEAEKARALSQKKQAFGQALSFRSRAEATEYNISVSEENRKIAEMGMEDIRHQMAVAISNRRLKGRKIEGQQLSQMAASGLMSFSGTGAMILQDTKYQTQKDIVETMNNANKLMYERQLDIWSAKQQEDLLRMSARNDRISAAFAEASGISATQIGAQTAAAARAAGRAQQWAGYASLANQAYDFFHRQN